MAKMTIGSIEKADGYEVEKEYDSTLERIDPGEVEPATGNEFQRFDTLTSRLVRVSKSELDEKRAES